MRETISIFDFRILFDLRTAILFLYLQAVAESLHFSNRHLLVCQRKAWALLRVTACLTESEALIVLYPNIENWPLAGTGSQPNGGAFMHGQSFPPCPAAYCLESRFPMYSVFDIFPSFQ